MKWLLFIALMAFSITTASAEQSSEIPWDVKRFGKTPQTYPAPGFEREGVKALYFESLPWRGKPTRIFAYVGFPQTTDKKVPGIVLVHGGGGTAFAHWVRMWNQRGYAAIAFDTYGGVPGGDPKQLYSHRQPMGGPSDAFEIEPQEDKWPYHGVANIMLANSLLRSYPQVDVKRVGITGVSWGGYLTCLAAGIDDRFKFAAPVYGCGFLRDDSAWLENFKQMGEANAATWHRLWDPSRYLSRAKMPILWVDGTNDLAFPLPSVQKTYHLLPAKQSTLSIRVAMEHSHRAGENPPEILAFADSITRKAPLLTKITSQTRKGSEVSVSFRAKQPIVRAELNFTKDTGQWLNRQWQTVSAAVDTAKHKVTATLPMDTKVYYLNLVDEQGLIVSSDFVEIAPSNN